MKRIHKEKLAIIGIGCRFPGNANSAEGLWQLISEKRDALSKIPVERWDCDAFFAPEFDRAGKISVTRSGYIENIDQFDAGFFGISPREAERMDPQQRIMLEVSYETLQDASISLDVIAGSKMAVFIGASLAEYGDQQRQPSERTNIGAHSAVGSALSILSNRISYVYNLKGPSMVIDTACSSSLNAIHMACRAIWDGDAESALAGGVNLLLRPESHMMFSKGGFLSPDGTCFSFDERANGYVRSEGAGMILIKPLEQAEKDGDNIYAIIRSSAVNQDGSTNGISVPDLQAQVSLIAEACHDAGIDPHEISYVEAHGTGTPVGDPIEANAIGQVIGKNREAPCYIGSIKSNIGHLEPAAGIAGIIKLALALKHKVIPPNIHFRKGNPAIAFDQLKLRVPTESMLWPANKDGQRLAGINSFGFGGANAHLILQGYDQKSSQGSETQVSKPSSGKESPLVTTLSARSKTALNTLAKSFADWLGADNPHSLKEICYTTNVRNTHHEYRLAIVADSKQELAESLDHWVQEESDLWLLEGRAGNTIRDKSNHDNTSNIVFVFSGQGAQWWGMGRQLLNSHSGFRATIETLDALLSKHADWSLLEELERSQQDSRIAATNIAQPAIFAIQVALLDMWKKMGVIPRAVTGHSIGEVAAAYASGALSLEQAVLLIFHRSRIQAKASGKGIMLAVGLTPDQASAMIKGQEAVIVIAAINAPEMVTLSGDTEALQALATTLEQQGIFYRQLDVNVPFHSHHMQSLRGELIASLGDFRPSSTRIPFYSTVEGKQLDGEALTPDYWFRNVREPVNFMQVIETFAQEGDEEGLATFIELGPHPVHAAHISELLALHHREGIVVPSMRREEDEQRVFLSAAVRLHTQGVDIDWSSLYGDRPQPIKLPPYPWQQERFWLETEECQRLRMHPFEVHPHLRNKSVSAREGVNVRWDVCLDQRVYPYIGDHRLQGTIVYPGAGHIDLVLSVALDTFGKDFTFLEDIHFESPLFLPDSGEPPMIQIEVSHDEGNFYIYSKARNDYLSDWTLCSRGRINHLGDHFEPISFDPEAIDASATISLPCDSSVYDALVRQTGLQLESGFRSLRQLWVTKTSRKFRGIVNLNTSILVETPHFTIHPAILDGCVQCLRLALNDNDFSSGLYLPRYISRIKFYQKISTQVLITYGQILEFTDDHLLGNLWVFDEQKKPVMELQGFQMQYLKGTGERNTENLNKWFYEFHWQMKSGKKQRRYPQQYLASLADVSSGINKVITDFRESTMETLLRKFEPEQHVLVIGYICQALVKMGLLFDPEKPINVEDLIRRFNIIKDQQKLFRHLFIMLEQAGILSGQQGLFTVLHVPDISGLDLRLRDLHDKFPDFQHEIALFARCAGKIKQVLQGDTNAIALLFSEEHWDNIKDFYKKSGVVGTYNEIAAAAMSGLMKQLPAHQTLRILEIGAGTGGMTGMILPILPVDRTEYIFTDLSPMFLQKARQSFAQYPFVQYGLLDIERPVQESCFEAHSFDMVLASNVIHACSDLKNALENIDDLLAPGGIFMMLELTNAMELIELAFAMTEGWWLFKDKHLRSDSPLMKRDKWQDLLLRTGYKEITSYSLESDDTKPCQTLFLAHSGKNAIKSAGKNLPADQTLPNTSLSQVVSPISSETANWLVLADDGGVADRIARQLPDSKTCILARKGEQFQSKPKHEFLVNPHGTDDLEKLLSYAAEQGALQGVVFAWGLDNTNNLNLNHRSIVESENRSSVALIRLMTYLYHMDLNEPPALWVITSGAQSVVGIPEIVNLSQSGLRGLCRVICSEMPVYQTTLVDLGAPVLDTELELLVEEMFACSGDFELAFRGTGRFVNKIERLSQQQIVSSSLKKMQAVNASFQADMSQFGVLDNLIFREVAERPPGDKEVKIAVRSAGLNFRDVMMALKFYDDASILGGYFGKNLGIECSGVVTAVGSGVSKFKLGDPVMAIAVGSLAGVAYGYADLCLHKPDHLNWQQAAGLTGTLLTAHYSLLDRGRLKKAEKVLIHAAAGGVGIMAVQIAMAVGAEVFATVSSQEKRAYLEKLGVRSNHIMNSRTLTFYDEIMSLTQGEGVDVILNSLSGKAIVQSIKCLKGFGRFIEIGKTDLARNTQLGLQPFMNNLTYSVIDIDRLCRQHKQASGQLLSESVNFFIEQGLSPHPLDIFPVSRLTDAFHHMAAARHIGKVIVSMEGEIAVVPPKKLQFRENVTYLITGGASGLGLEVAKWMSSRGCKYLVLASRRIDRKETQVAVSLLESRGVKVLVIATDVTCPESVAHLFTEIRDQMPPLAGVQHAAMVLDDGMIHNMSPKQYLNVFKTKAVGCWLLHEATKAMNLDHFVLYSSFTSLIGNPGQSNYVAGCHFLDNFAQWRRSQGLQAICINWGAIAGAGYVASSKGGMESFEKGGWKAFTLNQFFWIFEQMLLNNPVQRGAWDIDWHTWFDHLSGPDKSIDRFRHLTSDQPLNNSVQADKNFGQLLLDSPSEDRYSQLTAALKHILSRVTTTSEDKIDIDEPLTRYGIDSLMANQIRNWIQTNISVDYSMMQIMKGPSIDKMASHILEIICDKPSSESASEGSDITRRGNDWIRCSGCQLPRLRLFCFPYLGGGASVFNTWCNSLPDDIEVCAIQLPGVEDRRNEAPYDDPQLLRKKLFKAISPLLDVPFAFYGHSMGSQIAFDQVKYIEKKMGIIPEHLLLGSTIAPHLAKETGALVIRKFDIESVYDDDKIHLIKDYLRSLEAPDSVLENEATFNELLPVARALIVMSKRHELIDDQPLACPITVIRGVDDSVYCDEQLQAWERYTSKVFRFTQVKGSHLFCRDNPKELLEILSGILR